jgi:hypothetical protein
MFIIKTLIASAAALALSGCAGCTTIASSSNWR